MKQDNRNLFIIYPGYHDSPRVAAPSLSMCVCVCISMSFKGCSVHLNRTNFLFSLSLSFSLRGSTFTPLVILKNEDVICVKTGLKNPDTLKFLHGLYVLLFSETKLPHGVKCCPPKDGVHLFTSSPRAFVLYMCVS